MIDYLAVTKSVTSCTKKSNRKQTDTLWSNKEGFAIEKYAAENGHAAAVRKFASKEKPMNESTVRKFCKRYKKELKQSTKEKHEMKKELPLLSRARPLMLGLLDQMAQKYIRAYRGRGSESSQYLLQRCQLHETHS